MKPFSVVAWFKVLAVALIQLALLRLPARAAQEPARSAAAASAWDTFSDTWAATDALGRTLPAYEQVGPPRKDRYIALFYFLWLGEHANGGPYDITKIRQQDPEAMTRPDSPLWGPPYAPHYWGEPLFGYYLTDDAYVLRKHAQMLADAGVDVIVFDITNQFTYKANYMALLKAFAEIRAAGGKTPQIAFLCPFWEPAKAFSELWRDLYEPGLYRDLWFQWQGKPLILADPDLLFAGEGTTQQNTPAALEPGHTLGQTFRVTAPFDAVGGRFPTFNTQGAAMTLSLRRDGPRGPLLATRRFTAITDNAWLSLRPESPLLPGAYCLEMSAPQGRVGWWSHTQDVYPQGEALADGLPIPGDRTLRISTLNGRDSRIRQFFTFRTPQPDYFHGPAGPDMWSWLEVYPQHVFRNSKGQAEQMSVGVAQNAVDHRLATLSEPDSRGRNWHNNANDTTPDAVLHGYNFAEQFEHALRQDPQLIFITGWNEWVAGRFPEFGGIKRPVMFVDEYSQEYSRDIEPMRDGHGDDYYYQMVSYIRRYKGVRKPPTATAPQTIRLDGDFRQWQAVRPEYRDDIGDASHRDHPGFNHFTRYTNATGRNDFTLLKVARDARYLYFYARTRDAISPHTDPHWMLLFLSTGRKGSANWEGYDFMVNRKIQSAGTTTLERSLGGWNWRHQANVRYRVRGNELMLAIRRADLGLSDPRKPLHLDFKWADNIQKEGDITEFTLNGDAAPNNRFNYRYHATVR